MKPETYVNASLVISKEVSNYNKSRTLNQWFVEFRPDALSFFVHYVNEEDRNIINSTLVNLLN
jgi:hypothetical protein